MSENKDSFWETIKGMIASILIFSAFAGISMLMFYICMKIFGVEL